MILEKIRGMVRENTTKENYLKIIIENLEASIVVINDSKNNKFKTDIDKIIQKFSTSQLYIFDEDTFYFFKKLLNIDEKIVYHEKTLNYINLLLYIFYNCNPMKLEFTWVKVEALADFPIHELVSESTYYFLDFDKKNKVLVFSDQKKLIDIIDNSNLNELFYLYKSSKTIQSREMSMTNIAKKIRGLFNDKPNKHKDKTDILDAKIGKQSRIKISAYLHGYFMHDKNESNQKEAQEWPTFNETKKNKIMEELFVDILYCLAILRINKLLTDDLF